MSLANWLNIAGLVACLLGSFGLRTLATPRGASIAFALPRFAQGGRFRERWHGRFLRHSWDAVVVGFLLQIFAQFF